MTLVDLKGTLRKVSARTGPQWSAPVSELYIARCDFMRRQMEDPIPYDRLTLTVLSNPLPLTCLGKDYGSYTNSLKLFPFVGPIFLFR